MPEAIERMTPEQCRGKLGDYLRGLAKKSLRLDCELARHRSRAEQDHQREYLLSFDESVHLLSPLGTTNEKDREWP
jgi:hypothetical protein